MIKTRTNFETNSSSMHSLSLSDSDVFQEIYLLGWEEDGVFYIEGDTQFGCSWEIYDDPASKASYLYIDSGKSQRIKDVIAKHVGVKEVVFKGIDDDTSEWCSYYIDHQSRGLTAKLYNSDDDEEIWKFIMNDSEIRTGSDNWEGPW